MFFILFKSIFLRNRPLSNARWCPGLLWLQTVTFCHRKCPSRNNQDSPASSMKGSVTIPYARGVSEGLRLVITGGGVGVHFKPRNSLREHLVSPKDKFKEEERCHTVYEHSCKTCSVSYIGETKRPLGVRNSEHKRKLSPVAIHARTTGHNIPTSEARVLDQGNLGKIRRSSLNRDGGRYHLPAVYNSILSRLSASGDGCSDSHQ